MALTSESVAVTTAAAGPGLGRLVVRMAALVLVVVLPLAASPFGTDAYSGPKAFILYGLAAIVALSWVAARREASETTMPVPAEIAVLALCFLLLLSSALSVRPRLTVFGAPGRYEGLLAFAAYAVLFMAGARFLASEHEFRRLARAAGAAAALAAIYGILQLGMQPLLPGEAVIRDWYSTIGFTRVFSTLGNPVIFGAYLGLMLPVLMALSMSSPPVERVLWSVASGLAVTATVLTLTRAAWGSAVLSSLFFLWTVRGAGRARLSGAAAAVAVGALIGVAALTFTTGAPSGVAGRIASSADIQAGSIGQRLYIWKTTARLIVERPLLGWGLETLREVFPYDRKSLVPVFGSRPVIIDKVHNDLLQVAVSAGVPAAGAYAAFWVAAVAAGMRLVRRTRGEAKILAAGWVAGLGAYLLQVQFSFSAVAVAPLVWLFSGAACGWDTQEAVDRA